MAATSAHHIKRQVSARQHLAINLVVMRRTRGWSQEDLALEAGLHRTFVAHVERGARNIAVDNIEKLAAAFGVETYRLLMPQSSEAG
jgi:transcriptional regulator with XRE-family HTH domain